MSKFTELMPTTRDGQGLKAVVNGQRGKHPWERSSQLLECRVYADTFRDVGNEPMADLWAAVADFLEVWHANGKLTGTWDREVEGRDYGTTPADYEAWYP